MNSKRNDFCDKVIITFSEKKALIFLNLNMIEISIKIFEILTYMFDIMTKIIELSIKMLDILT